MFIPLKTYPISIAVAASAALPLAEIWPGGELEGRDHQAMLYAAGCDAIVKFTNSAADTASITLTDHVTNGTFAADTDWTKGTGWTIAAGVADAAGAISTSISQNSALSLKYGRAYTVTYTITRAAGTITPVIGGTAGTTRNSAGTYTEVIIAGQYDRTIVFNTAGFTGTLDNVSVKSTAYPDGNFPLIEGAIPIVGGVKRYVSVMSLDGVTTGTLYLTVGYNENSGV